jgi:hypothetical protein
VNTLLPRFVAVSFLLCGVAVLSARGAGTSSAAARPEADTRVWQHPHAWYGGVIKRTRDLPPELRYSELRLKIGDDPQWARADWDDRDWQVIRFQQLPPRAGVFWLRFRVRMDDPAKRLASGFFTAAPLAYEVFWDGVPVAANGVPGNSRESEKPGRLDNIVTLPLYLLGPGEHVVAMRASSHYAPPTLRAAFLSFLVDAPADAHTAIARYMIQPLVAIGAMLMVTLAVVLLWLFAGRRRALLPLAGLCLAAAGMQFVFVFRWFWGFTYEQYEIAETFSATLVAAMAVFLLAFVVAQFAVRRGWLLVLTIVPILVLLLMAKPGRDSFETRSMLLAGLAGAALISAWAAWRRRRGGWLATAGFVLSMVILVNHWYYSMRTDFYIMFLPAMVGIIATVGLQLRAEHREAREARLMATRLEIELLKKNLQPHFLLNTLTALMEVIEQEPRQAVKLIDDLAGEFRLMAAMSAEKTVPLTQEIELCRSHLRVMSVRMGTAFTLEVDGANGDRRVPPALFLTLIENAFSHQRVRGPSSIFRLRCEPLRNGADGGGVRFTFVAPGEVQSDAGRPPGGTGLRYVKARLEESSPGAWNFRDGPTASGWETVVEITHAGVAHAR